MTDLQKRFADEYLITLNGSEAYRKINPTTKQADSLANKMLNHPEVKAYISEVLESITYKLNLKAIDVIKETKDIAFSDIKNYLSFDSKGVKFKNSDAIDCRAVSEVSSSAIVMGSGDEDNKTIEKVNFKIKLYDKMKALELLGKYFKLFTDKVEITGKDGKDLINEVKITIVK